MQSSKKIVWVLTRIYEECLFGPPIAVYYTKNQSGNALGGLNFPFFQLRFKFSRTLAQCQVSTIMNNNPFAKWVKL